MDADLSLGEIKEPLKKLADRLHEQLLRHVDMHQFLILDLLYVRYQLDNLVAEIEKMEHRKNNREI